MGRSFIILVGLALILLALDCSFADTKVDVKANPVSDSNSHSTSISDEKVDRSKLVLNETEEVDKDGVQLTGSKEGIENFTNKINEQSGLRGTGNLQKGKGELSDSSEHEKESEKKKGSDEAGSITSTQLRKEGFHGEECDPSNMCTDEEDQFVACLRVPGNDSPHLSLLIQNKGKDALSVTISAPSFVQLEKSEVQLQKNENKKVKVTIRSGGSNNSITLAARKGRCSLDLRDLIAQNTGKDSITSSNSTYKSFPSQTLAVVSFFFALILILFVVFVFIQLRRRKFKANEYQRLDMELPVLNGTKPDKETSDGWNDDWGDDWDDENNDEEAPKASSVILTPTFASRGLASRRLGKEGWKD